MTVLATLASFTQVSHLSTLLYDDRVSMTPLTVQRLRKLADVIHFKGDLFEASR